MIDKETNKEQENKIEKVNIKRQKKIDKFHQFLKAKQELEGEIIDDCEVFILEENSGIAYIVRYEEQDEQDFKLTSIKECPAYIKEKKKETVLLDDYVSKKGEGIEIEIIEDEV